MTKEKVTNNAEQAQNQQLTTENTTTVPRICSSKNITATKATPCTVDHMLDLMAQPKTQQICDALATLNNLQWCDNQTLNSITSQPWAKQLINAAERRDRANKNLTPSDTKYTHYTSHEQVFRAIKEGLTVTYFHTQKFKNDQRNTANAIQNLLYMLDLDHVTNPREIARLAHLDNADFCHNNQIAYAGVTPSSHGIRVVGVLTEGKNIEHAQTELATYIAKQVLSATSITVTDNDIHTWLYGNDNTQGHFDTCCTDLARASFLPSKDHIIYIDKSLLQFSSQKEADNAANQALNSQNNTQTYTAPSLSTATTTTTASFPTTYITDNSNTIEYKALAQNICTIKAKNKPIQEGVRNNILYLAAKALKPVCGNNPQWIASILPTYGLPQSEINSICENACKYGTQSLDFQKDLAQAIMMTESAAPLTRTPSSAPTTQQVPEDLQPEDLDPNSLPLPPLPEPLATLCKYVPMKYRWALTMACLPQIGALLSGVRFRIGQKQHALAFTTLVFGPPRSFKGTVLDGPVYALQVPIREADERANEIRDRYLDQKDSKKEELPENPHAEPRIVSMAAGESAILDALIDNPGKAVVGYTPEIDNLIAGLGKGTWALPKSAFKDAFDLALRGTTYKSRTKKQVPFFYNLTATGTLNCLPAFLDDSDVEGGLATRLILVKFPFQEFQPEPDIRDYTKEDYEKIVHICRTFNEMEIATYHCKFLHDWLDDWKEKKRQMAEETQNYALYDHYLRAGIIGIRAAYYAAVAYGIAHKEGEPKLKQNAELKKLQKQTIQFAEGVAEYTLMSQLLLVGDKSAQVSKKSIAPSQAMRQYAKQTGVKAVLAQLPDEFGYKDVVQARLNMGYAAGEGAHRDITRMTQRGLVQKVIENGIETEKYRKL